MADTLFGDGNGDAVPDTTPAEADKPAATALSQKLAPGGGGGGCWLGGPRTASSDKWQADKQPKYSPLRAENLFGEDIRGNGPLAQKFTFPPFTVLSARDGDWQGRKRAWLALGIQSELGRGSMARSDGFADATAVMRGEYVHKTDPADTLGAMKKQYSGVGGNLPFAKNAEPAGRAFPAMKQPKDENGWARGTGNGKKIDGRY